MKETVLPKSLKKGDKIAVISPAGAVEESQLTPTLQLIEKKGYIPVLGKYALGKYNNGYNYSGTEKERIKDLNWALNDNDIRAVWATRGGYGCQQLIQHLRLNKYRENPKWYIGYSDNTVIQSFLLKKGFASIHGQTIKTSSFGVTEESYEKIFGILEGKKPSYTIELSNLNKKGSTEGELIGGNLALVYALLGTGYGFDFKDKILFIEDIGESYYSLDRMMMSLELAGVFRKIKGLIIGGMTNMGDEKENPHYEDSFDPMAYKIIAEKISKYDFPTLFGFPNGHIKDNRPLIIGGHVNIKEGKTVEVSF